MLLTQEIPHSQGCKYNLIINNGPMGITYLSTGAGFLPSTVDYRIIRLDFIDELLHLPQISCRTWPSSKGNSRKQCPCFTSIVEGRVLVYLSHHSTPKIFTSPETENDSYAGEWLSPSLHFHPDSGFNMSESSCGFHSHMGDSKFETHIFWTGLKPPRNEKF